jgi:cytochrome c heme-lyase
MGWWKADPVPERQQTIPGPPTQTAPHPLPAGADISACPVDSKTREIWLHQAKQQSQAKKSISSQPIPQTASVTASPAKAFASAPSEQCSSDRIDQSTSPSSKVQPFKNLRPLSQDREVSTIPRAYIDAGPASVGKPPTTLPSNAETETGHDKASGNWIYPSESQFFTAVMRKHPDATSPADLASSVSSIIPIHNAVNERAWSMIKQWEAGQPTNKSCNGPKLLRFEGKGAGAKSPRAMMKSWSGYQEPFDRHDWTIQRCDGAEIEYIIDFYQGRSPAGQVSPGANGQQGINFYLDVRPKLNSIEGCKMRLTSFVGWK